MLEVDAIAYVSCPGKLPSLENLVIQYFVPEPSYSRFTDFRGYNASDDETLVSSFTISCAIVTTISFRFTRFFMKLNASWKITTRRLTTVTASINS